MDEMSQRDQFTSGAPSHGRGPASDILGHISQSRLSQSMDKNIWAIGGGKGGVGKSLVSSNIAIALAKVGYKVVSVDLDLGGANLHTCLGIPIPQKTLSDYIGKKVFNINDIVVKTPIANLSLISGAQDEIGMANLKNIQKNKLLKGFEALDADFIILDLGAGTAYNTLDFFIASDQGMLVTLPEPTSIENTYRFIKSVFYRKLSMFEETFDLQPIMEKAYRAKISQNMSMPLEVLDIIKKASSNIGELIEKEMERMKFQLIINQVRNHKDKELGYAIEKICKKYFGITVEYAGYLEYDTSVWQSVKIRKPLMQEFPNSLVATNIQRITSTILKGLS